MSQLKYWNGSEWVSAKLSPSGAQGIQGIQGFQGITGQIGSQGLQGIQGTQGSQGTLGLSGIIAQNDPPSSTEVLWLDTDEDIVESQSLINEISPINLNGAHFDGTGLKCYNLNANYASAPNIAAYQITGDITLIAYLVANDWSPTTTQVLINRAGSGDLTLGSYSFALLGSTNAGKLDLFWTNGTTGLSTSSSTAVPFTDGQGGWVAVAFDVDNGSGQRVTKFYTSTDSSNTAISSINWTQLGTTQTATGATSINAGTRALFIGARNNQLDLGFDGIIKRAVVSSGIGPDVTPGGTVAFDADFESVPSDSFAFTESSANAATVTLTTTRYHFGVPGASLLSTTTNNTGANTTLYMPFRVSTKPITLKSLSFEVTSAPAAAADVRVAIYAADINMQPTGAPLLQSGIIPVSAGVTGIYRTKLNPTILPRGNYLIAYNTTALINLRLWLVPNRIFFGNTLGANAQVNYFVSQTLSSNFPNTPVLWNGKSAANSGQRYYIILGWEQ